MQRLFSTFPSGMPGLALLLLRCTLGFTAIISGGAYLYNQENPAFLVLIISFFYIICGAFLLIGLMTPLAAISVLLGCVGTVISIIPAANDNFTNPNLTAIYLSIMAIAVILLGPGAFSLDARMFGRREISIPDKPNPPKS